MQCITRGKSLILLLSLVFLLFGCASTRMAQELELGKQSFNSGNFKIAFQQLMPLAVQGDPKAQYAIGFMYYYGYGVPQDSQSGEFWIKRSADKSYVPAVHAIALLNSGEKGLQDKISVIHPAPNLVLKDTESFPSTSHIG